MTDQKEFKNQLKPQKNENTARCPSFQVKYKLRSHYKMVMVCKITKKIFLNMLRYERFFIRGIDDVKKVLYKYILISLIPFLTIFSS